MDKYIHKSEKLSHAFSQACAFVSRHFHRKPNDSLTKEQRAGRCMVYRTDRKFIFETVYYVNGSYPIEFLPLDCNNQDFGNTLTDILRTSAHGEYIEISDSELIKAMKQRSWRQLYRNSDSALVIRDGSKLTILPTRPAADNRGLEWNYDRELSFDLDIASWENIIVSIRKLLENNETDR